MNESQPIRDKGAEVLASDESAPLTLRKGLDDGLAPSLCMCQYCIEKRFAELRRKNENKVFGGLLILTFLLGASLICFVLSGS